MASVQEPQSSGASCIRHKRASSAGGTGFKRYCRAPVPQSAVSQSSGTAEHYGTALSCVLTHLQQLWPQGVVPGEQQPPTEFGVPRQHTLLAQTEPDWGQQ